MKLKFAHRAGVTGALLAAILGALIVFVPTSASAAASPWTCFGDGVKRCMRLTCDPSTNKIRAHALIRDVRGGRNFTVWVKNVKLHHSPTGNVLRHNPDRDGAHAVKDGAGTGTYDMDNVSRKQFWAEAYFYWKRDGSSGNSQVSTDHRSPSEIC